MVRETARHRAPRRPQHSILNTEWHVQIINITKGKKGVKFIYMNAVRYMRPNISFHGATLDIVWLLTLAPYSIKLSAQHLVILYNNGLS